MALQPGAMVHGQRHGPQGRGRKEAECCKLAECMQQGREGRGSAQWSMGNVTDLKVRGAGCCNVLEFTSKDLRAGAGRSGPGGNVTVLKVGCCNVQECIQ